MFERDCAFMKGVKYEAKLRNEEEKMVKIKRAHFSTWPKRLFLFSRSSCAQQGIVNNQGKEEKSPQKEGDMERTRVALIKIEIFLSIRAVAMCSSGWKKKSSQTHTPPLTWLAGHSDNKRACRLSIKLVDSVVALHVTAKPWLSECVKRAREIGNRL